MKSPNFLLKVAAVGSSVLLVGGLISYQAGAFKNLLSPETPAAAAERNDSVADKPSGQLTSMDLDEMAETAFRIADVDGDGLLNFDEMSDTLKAEREKWDKNEDGFIDLNEFKAYYLTHLKQQFTEDELKAQLKQFAKSEGKTGSSPTSNESSSASKSGTPDAAQPTKGFMGGTKSAPVFVPQSNHWVFPPDTPEPSKPAP